MPRYTLHYNPACQDCVRRAHWNARLDWLRRFARIAGPSPNGMPELGDIHVVDNRTSVIYSGAYATRVVCLNIIGLLLRCCAFLSFSKPSHGGSRAAMATSAQYKIDYYVNFECLSPSPCASPVDPGLLAVWFACRRDPHPCGYRRFLSRDIS